MSAAAEKLPVDDASLTALLTTMQDPREAVAGNGPWHVTDGWRSFKADFVKAVGSAGEVAVKFGDGWTKHDARYVAQEVERVHELFANLPGGAVLMPRSLGWSDQPAAVALAFIEGTPLFQVFGDRRHALWRDGGERVVALARQCGQAVGAYHSAEPVIEDAAIARGALSDLLSAAKRAGIRKSTMLRLEPHLQRARGYRFSPNDLMVDETGRLVMLDPPHLRKFDYLPRDVSAFTFELHKAVIGEHAVGRDDPNLKTLHELRGAFFAGYAATGPSPLDSDLETWVLRVFEISRVTGAAYARLRRRMARRALPLLRWALQLRRGLGRPPRLPGEMSR